MDDLARYNKERWEALAQANIMFSRPMLDLDVESAKRVVNTEGILDDVSGRDVLCLASGGGQQSAALALLGARVTALDLSETQLERDREAAAHYGVEVRTLQGDMRDLSAFDDNAFDIVWHGHSLNFVPDARTVFAEVARVLRPGGYYRMDCVNPFIHGTHEEMWNGKGYPICQPYQDGGEVAYDDPHWDIGNEDGTKTRVRGPHEFRHALSTLLNAPIRLGFRLLGTWELPAGPDGLAEPAPLEQLPLPGDPNAEPGSWDHFKAFAPPYLLFWWEMDGSPVPS